MPGQGGPATFVDAIRCPGGIERPLDIAFRDAVQCRDLLLHVLPDHVQCRASGEGRQQHDVHPAVFFDPNFLDKPEFNDAAGQFRIRNAAKNRMNRVDVLVAAHHAAPGSADRTAPISAWAAAK